MMYRKKRIRSGSVCTMYSFMYVLCMHLSMYSTYQTPRIDLRDFSCTTFIFQSHLSLMPP